MSDGFTPIKGKCTWWRERANEEDSFNTRLKAELRRVDCSCFVEGDVWEYTAAELPADCPKYKSCRYYIKHL